MRPEQIFIPSAYKNFRKRTRLHLAGHNETESVAGTWGMLILFVVGLVDLFFVKVIFVYNGNTLSSQ